MSVQINREAEAVIPTRWGTFNMIAYVSDVSGYSPNLALVHPDIDTNNPVDVRIHSECITGDLFHSQRCDCGDQLHAAMQHLSMSKGVLIYLRQEGRGIGIINKLKAYNKQDQGMDTIEANLALGLEVDSRQYDRAIAILQNLNIDRINLLSNNPEKIKAFDDAPVQLVKRLPLEIKANKNNAGYLRTKKDDLGHLINL